MRFPENLSFASLLPHHSRLCSRKEILGALSLVTTMLDGHTQMVLGDSQSGDLSPSQLTSAFDHRQRQPFCGDWEGWGPLSLNGFYLTSCFVDVVVAVVAVWGSLAGLAALWMLLKKRIPQPVSKNWHFYAKLVSRPHFPRTPAFLPMLIMSLRMLIGRSRWSDLRHCT